MPIAVGTLVVVAVIGLVEAMLVSASEAPPAAARKSVKPPKTSAEKPKADSAAHKIHGRCVDHADSSPIPGLRVLLFEILGRTLPIVQVGQTFTDANGSFEFTNLVPPNPSDRLDPLLYTVVAFGDDRPISAYIVGHSRQQEQHGIELRLSREEATLSGRIVNARGQPVAGATVGTYWFEGRTFPGLLSAVTGTDGRFAVNKLPVFRTPDGTQLGSSFRVVHSGYPETKRSVETLPADVSITLPDGCTLTGQVTDSVTRQPAANALITSALSEGLTVSEFVTSSDATGRFRIVVPEGRYTVLAEAPDRVCVALTDRECPAGRTVDLPPLRLIAGGLISGQVVNTSSGQTVSQSEIGDPILLGLYGPSFPSGHVISPVRLATTDESGHFTLRAAPGENFPYLVNTHGDRMAWDTRNQPPVVVKEGQTTAYNMLITPPVPPEEKLKAARVLAAALPKEPSARTAQILAEFRKLSHTADETELWCTLMRELVAIGPSAVPQISEELDHTTQDRAIRRLAFALRAIGDPRAVPALIRAIPKTLLPPSSDYGLIVSDVKLAEFMQRHDLGDEKGLYFSFGRPVREVFGTLHKLTGQDFGDDEIFSIHLSEDPRRQVFQRRLYRRQALRWQTWWETHGKKFTREPAYEKVHLIAADETLPPASTLPTHPAPSHPILRHPARLGDGDVGEVLSPAGEGGRYVTYFYDLDTGYEPQWPVPIPKDESRLDSKALAKWAAETGVDLMCVTHRAADGSKTFVLKAFDMRVWEITPRDVRNLDHLLAAGNLPQGRPVGELLMHYDAESRQPVPDANAAFLYMTREGNLGLIEITDRIRKTADITGMMMTPQGVGFHKGVQFNLRPIIP
jgi:hypothetical protein